MKGHLKLSSIRLGRIGRGTLLSTAGLGARAAIQAAYLIIASRWLGAESYGLFAASAAFVTLTAPLASWGSTLLLTQHIAVNRKRSRAMWATALVQTLVTGCLLTSATMLASALLPVQALPLHSLLLLAVAEIVLLPLSHVATSQCYAIEHGPASALSVCLAPLGRVLALSSAAALATTSSPELAVLAHFLGTLLALSAATAIVVWIDGPPAWKSRLPLRQSIRQGTGYAISSAAITNYQEVDKVIMLQFIGAVTIGPYIAAFRIASLFLLPVSALISTIMPRLMAECKNTQSPPLFRITLFSVLCYGACAGVGILAVSPLVPLLLGDGYGEVTSHLILFAPWPFFFSLRHCLATKLTVDGRQDLRVATELSALLLVILLNLKLLPTFGVGAAVAALLVTELMASGAFLLSLRAHRSRQR